MWQSRTSSEQLSALVSTSSILQEQAENPYAAPQTVPELMDAAKDDSPWSNRLATVGFLFSLLFPIVALAALGALLMEDEFGVVRWRVHRLIRMTLFRTSMASVASVAFSMAGLAVSPRRLAIYGLIIGAMGSSYWMLAMVGILRR